MFVTWLLLFFVWLVLLLVCLVVVFVMFVGVVIAVGVCCLLIRLFVLGCSLGFCFGCFDLLIVLV